MKISIITLFPEMFRGPFEYSIVLRAQKAKHISIETIQLRDFAINKYKTVDGKPYGGGVGMILRVDVIDRAITSVLRTNHFTREQTHILLTDPRGKTLTQHMLSTLSSFEHLIIIAGHYEGVDERVYTLIDEAISIGNYILTGGEIPAMVLTDSIVRLIPGVLKNRIAVEDESFSAPGRHEYPQYTAPREYLGEPVPTVLLGGNHKAIAGWKTQHTQLAENGSALLP